MDLNLRSCKLCKSGSIEDEKHFATQCTSFASDRNELFKTMSQLSVHFNTMSNEQKFIWMFINEDKNAIVALSEYISKCYNLRSNILKTV